MLLREIQKEFRNDFLQQTQPNKPTMMTLCVAGGCSNQSNRETDKCFFVLLFNQVPKIVVHRGEKYKKSFVCGLEGSSRMMAPFVCKISLPLKLVCSFSLGEFVPLELTSFIGLVRLIRDILLISIKRFFC